MSALFLVNGRTNGTLAAAFPKSHGKPRVDDHRVLSGIIFVNRNNMRWCDAPRECAGRFYVQWWDGHQGKRLSLGTADREEARRALRQFLIGLETPEDPVIAEIRIGYAQDREGKVRSIASIRHARAALAEHPGDLTPDQIATKVSRNHASARRVQGRRGRAEKGKPLSDGALIREVVTLHAALQWAFDELWIERAPRIEAPPAPPMKERWLTPGEARRFLDATETLHDQSRHGQQQQAPVNRAHGSRAACRHVGCRYDPDE